MFEVDLNVTPVLDVLSRLVSGVNDTRPVFAAIGERVIESAKTSFERSAAPDGTPWAPNRPSTLEHYLELIGGAYKKNGSISKKGEARLAGKKPLIGQSGDLSRQFSYTAEADSVTVSNSMVYAAMQQFGGSKAQFPHLWGDIPARPFFPITATGELTPDLQHELNAMMSGYLNGLLDA